MEWVSPTSLWELPPLTSLLLSPPSSREPPPSASLDYITNRWRHEPRRWWWGWECCGVSLKHLIKQILYLFKTVSWIILMPKSTSQISNNQSCLIIKQRENLRQNLTLWRVYTMQRFIMVAISFKKSPVPCKPKMIHNHIVHKEDMSRNIALSFSKKKKKKFTFWSALSSSLS